MADQPAPTPQAPTPPPEGYKEGGWYNGQRFMGGQLLAPGQDTPGHTVSAEVNQQSAKLQTPTNPNSVQDYLNNYQKAVHQSIGSQDLTGNNSEQVMGQAINDNRPAPPNLAATYQGLSQAYGIQDLNKQMTDLVNQRNQIQTSLKTAMNQTEHQPGVTADVVASRETEQQRQTQIQLDSTNLQIDTLSTQISNANNTIGMIMQFTQQDYQNAEQYYNDSFNQAMQAQQLFMQQQQFGLDVRKEAFSEKSTEQSLGMEGARLGLEQQAQSQRIASSNLQVVQNMMLNGQIDPSKMTKDQQTHIQSLELQSGLPQGITQQILSNSAVGSKAITTNKNTGQTLLQHPNGSFQVLDTGIATEPIKMPNGFMYSYDKSSGQYKFIPGQITGLDYLWKAATGSLPPQNLPGGGTVLVDPKTGDQYQYSSTSDPEYQSDLRKGFRTQ